MKQPREGGVQPPALMHKTPEAQRVYRFAPKSQSWGQDCPFCPWVGTVLPLAVASLKYINFMLFSSHFRGVALVSPANHSEPCYVESAMPGFGVRIGGWMGPSSSLKEGAI